VLRWFICRLYFWQVYAYTWTLAHAAGINFALTLDAAGARKHSFWTCTRAYGLAEMEALTLRWLLAQPPARHRCVMQLFYLIACLIGVAAPAAAVAGVFHLCL
jgi:hypothetical protein